MASTITTGTRTKSCPANRVERNRVDRNRVDLNRGGFTLIELMIAVSIIGGSFLLLLTMRTTAVDRTWEYTRDRRVQQVAREQLETVVYGDDEERSGSADGPPAMEWEVDIQSTDSAGVSELLECTIIVKWVDETDEDQEYKLSMRIFPPKDSPLLNGISD